MEVFAPASQNNPSALLHALQKGLQEAKLPVASGLEKRPRPMVTLGYPLPIGVPGHSEWADVVLEHEMSPEAFLEQARPWLPPGLRLLEVLEIPSHASSAAELADEALWTWDAGSLFQENTLQKIDSFIAAETFYIQKSGKTEGQKTLKHIEVRGWVREMHWQEKVLCFTTRLQQGQALNPAKLLGGILDLPSSEILGLSRLQVTLKEDPRLADSYKYATKLHNMFEDAVLLGISDDLSPMDDDDELLIG